MARTRATLEDAGVQIEDVVVTDVPRMPAAVLARILAEAGTYHRAAFESDPAGFGDDIAAVLRMPVRSAEHAAADEAAIQRFGSAIVDALASHDVLMSATVPIPAPPIGAHAVRLGDREWHVELLLTRLTSPFNATGLPAASVPVALADALPVGLQIAGARLRDDVVLQAARLVERLVPPLPAPAPRAGVAAG
jgi:aspartyl-tRNA(Asn)/glutamyl-tRNA(Gln) amidotransferase subunit A